jgi:hypothetical protein
MKKRLAAILALAMGFTWLVASPAEASVYNGSVAFTCTSANASGSGSHVLDRDNTGEGQEALRVEVTDGNGTIIFELNYSNFLGTYGGGIGDFAYTTPPATNPLSFTLTSLAGNGLPEQVDYVESGVCDEIPFTAPTLTAPPAAVAGDSVTVSGSGCPEGPVEARLVATEGSDPIATGAGTADADGDFTVELTVPDGTPEGDYLIEVVCGTFADPASEVAVAGIAITAPTPPPAPPAPPEPTTTQTTASAPAERVTPRFAG